MSKLHRLICSAAGLPKAMTVTGCRHGGITELGDAGEADTRALSGHAVLNTTAIYNKASTAKAQRIAAARRRYIEMLGDAEDLLE